MNFLRDIANRLSASQKEQVKYFISKIMGVYINVQKKSLAKEDLKKFLIQKFHLKKGDSVLIHSSMDRLAIWGMSVFEILKIIEDIVGEEGNILMPTFPTRDSEKYVENYKSFHVRKTPSHMGLITEVFRRKIGVERSLDPIRPFSTMGPDSEYFCSDHHLSVYSYDQKSPLYKVAEKGGKIIGLGVPLNNFTFVHTIENIMGDAFPVDIYNNQVYNLEVIDKNSTHLQVQKKIVKNSITKYCNIEKFSKNFNENVLHMFRFKFSPYFFCQADRFLEEYQKLANKGITIYPRKFNK